MDLALPKQDPALTHPNQKYFTVTTPTEGGKINSKQYFTVFSLLCTLGKMSQEFIVSNNWILCSFFAAIL